MWAWYDSGYMESPSYLKKFADTPGPLAAPTATPSTSSVEVPAKRTIPETLKLESKQFGAFIESFEDTEKIAMMDRFLKANPTPEDVKELEKVHDQYLEAKEKSDIMAAEIIGDTFTEIKNRSPYLASVCKQWGEDTIKELIRTGIKETVYTDRFLFEELSKRQAERLRLSEREGVLDKELIEYCQKYKLDPDTLVDKMKTQGDGAFDSYLQSHFTKDIGWFGFDRKGKLSGAARNSAEGSKLRRDFYAANGNREGILKSYGDFIGSLVSENDKWRTALARTALGERPAFVNAVEKQPSLQEAKGMMPSVNNVEKYVASYLKNLPQGQRKHPSKMDAAEFAAFEVPFEEHMQKETKKELQSRGGLWALLQFLTLDTVRFIDKPEIKAKLRQSV